MSRRGRRWRLLAAYAVAMFAWHLARPPADDEVRRPDMPTVSLAAVEGERRLPRSIRLAYGDYAGRGSGRSMPLVLLHGSPGRSDGFAALARPLSQRRRVVAPDLPGFGRSSRVLPDYSILAHAKYISDLLATLGIDRAHILGYSMGGGVAIHLADLDPGRVASVTLLSSVGVQEMELLGEYHLNHLVHGLQLTGFRALGWMLPHLGALDRPLPYARNFYDSDQRPLRGLLASLDVPILIVHGRQDTLVPVEAALEHARLVPQSELHLLDDDHLMVFRAPDQIAPLVNDFLARVDRGVAPGRAEADAIRVRRAAEPFDPRHVPRARGVSAVVLGAVVALLSAASSAGAVAAGVLVAQGRAGVVGTLAYCLVGALVLSRRWRPYETPAWRGMSTTARLLFGGLFGAGVLMTPLLSHVSAWPRALAVTATATAALTLAQAAISYRQRRLLFSTWLRCTRWEYWPPWIFYLPVVAWILVLAVRHRSVTVFTAANPSIEAGGFVGESKARILSNLRTATDRVARSVLIAGELSSQAKRDRAAAFLSAERLTPPIVVKPNNGQRGSGVVVAHTREELHAYLDRTRIDTMVQEYVPGAEFGVFYVRKPSETNGRILSVTEKHLPVVMGDGHSTVERLILEDRRTVAMARLHLRRHAARLLEVPLPGEQVLLGELGTHCRGAWFVDGGALLTPALDRAFDEMSKGFEGFYFGRYDVRTSSVEAFREGRDFTVIELNGVTSEATHIYDPTNGLMGAYRVLFEQWRLAFEIGSENVRRGAPVTGVGSLIALLLRYRETASQHLQPLS